MPARFPRLSPLVVALAALLAAPVAAQEEALSEQPSETTAPAAPAPAAPAPVLTEQAAPAPVPAPAEPPLSETAPAAPSPAVPLPAQADTATTPAEPAATDTPADSADLREIAPPPAIPAPPAPAAEPEPTELPVVHVEEPMPSPLQDPAGFVRYLLTRSERPEGAGHDLSPWGMYRAADIVVKLVMLGLAFASVVTWTVWLAKTLELAGAKLRARATLRAIRASQTLAEALRRNGRRRGPAAAMLLAAREEVARSDAAIDHAGGAGLKERLSSLLGRIEAWAGRRAGRGTGVLATIGSTAPFVGLFGTVWGIMNSFIGIAESNTTNLAVVAPGIAEALLATAIGLVAAIPAVVVYNLFARSIVGYRQLLADAAAGTERLVSRDLDFRRVPPADNVTELPAVRTALAAE